MNWVVKGVFTGKEYPLGFPESFKPSLIVDIGGNVGSAAIWFHAAYPEAKVESFEPSPSLFKFLESNVADYPAIRGHNIGLSDRATNATLHMGSKNVAQSSLIKTEASGDETENVEIRCAADEFKRLGLHEISILKIDTEGSELPILRSIQDWLGRTDAIFVEYHSEQDRRDIEGLLAANFYLIHASVQRPNLGSLVYFSKAASKAHGLSVGPVVSTQQKT